MTWTRLFQLQSKAAVTLAFICTNLVEFVSPHDRGPGAPFDNRKASGRPLMFAVLIALGIVHCYLVVVLEKIFAGWAVRGEGGIRSGRLL